MFLDGKFGNRSRRWGAFQPGAADAGGTGTGRKWFVFLVAASAPAESAVPSNILGLEVRCWEEVKKEGRF